MGKKGDEECEKNSHRVLMSTIDEWMHYNKDKEKICCSIYKGYKLFPECEGRRKVICKNH
ncbi:hypothetical protein IV49_GL001771 [Kandleria vitulina DSM 20405]|uniref:Uncharacterized protein n=1 Tax=Kandleria vitulina DSM 20405 TaxID=1410657 RepID=A0A0R2HEB8_9FIRM|nr:hypothetical protein IV49_GL001771 [Kandleria vitulina DSM 20405]